MKKMASTINTSHNQKEALFKHTQAFNAMLGGDGPQSYFRNSYYQGGIIDIAKPIIEEKVATNFDAQRLLSTSSNSSIYIADFGCSTGRNSFLTMQIIIEAIKQKLVESSSSSLVEPPKTVEFYVFFNDSIGNDFNTLFTSLPPDRVYHAVGVPGNFHECLLPKSSLHFAYSSWSLHWLTEAPKALVNKGRVYCTKERKEVYDAYFDQYSRDIESFLESRAFEMVPGGLMAIIVPGVPEFWNRETEYTLWTSIDILESCLMDMVKKGKLNEAKLDSFNFPLYFATPKQLKGILERNQNFTIETMDIFNNPGECTLSGADAHARVYRSIFERLLTNHFGSEIIDELFDIYKKKIVASPVYQDPDNDKSTMMLAVLKRKTD